MRVIGMIPARLDSGRLPRKLLLNSTGSPLILHTLEAASRAELDGLYVATDSEEIAAVVQQAGYTAFLTGQYTSGTCRIAAAYLANGLDADVIVNVQGDEPEVDPRHLRMLADVFRQDGATQMATLVTQIGNEQAPMLSDESRVKVAVARDQHALYFSRSAIPHNPLARWPANAYLHIGVYAYSSDLLRRWGHLPVGDLEQHENLEQLRALENGVRIRVVNVLGGHGGIDTAKDYADFVRRYQMRAK